MPWSRDKNGQSTVSFHGQSRSMSGNKNVSKNENPIFFKSELESLKLNYKNMMLI